VQKARDRDDAGRARQLRPRDALGRPLPYGSVGVTQIPDIPRSAVDTVDLARRLVLEGRAFSAHEVFESRWKQGPVEEQDLWQGLAQLCVAVTHADRGNSAGATRILQRAQGSLERYRESGRPTYGVDLTRAWLWAHDRVAAEGPSDSATAPGDIAGDPSDRSPHARWDPKGEAEPLEGVNPVDQDSDDASDDPVHGGGAGVG
jgi:hypothetical protein